MSCIEKEFKTAAYAFGKFLTSQGVNIKHTVLLSELAKAFGHRNWNTLSAKLKTIELEQPDLLKADSNKTKFDPENPEIWDGEFGVSLEYIGEGLKGDYDANDPEDKPLMRLDFMQKDGDGYLDELDGSACTFVSFKAAPAEKLKFLQGALNCVWKYVVPGTMSYKQLAGRLSWQDETWNGCLPD